MHNLSESFNGLKVIFKQLFYRTHVVPVWGQEFSKYELI